MIINSKPFIFERKINNESMWKIDVWAKTQWIKYIFKWDYIEFPEQNFDYIFKLNEYYQVVLNKNSINDLFLKKIKYIGDQDLKIHEISSGEPWKEHNINHEYKNLIANYHSYDVWRTGTYNNLINIIWHWYELWNKSFFLIDNYWNFILPNYLFNE